MLSVQAKGLERIKRDLREIPKELQAKVMDAATRAAAKLFADEAKARCTSARARKSIKVIRLRDKSDPWQSTYIVAAGFKTPFAHIIEFGADPHPINPNQKRRAAINYIVANADKAKYNRATVATGRRSVIRIQGEFVPMGRKGRPDAPAIQHPGVRSKPYMRPAWDQYSDEALSAFVKAAERSMIKMARSGLLTGQYWGNV